MQMGRCSTRLSPPREDDFIRGLYNAEALIGGIHSCQTGNLLTGAHLAPRRRDPLGHQLAIRSLPQQSGSQTKVPSLVLGCEQSIAAIHKNYSMIYSSHISWSAPTTPTPLEIYPALAFDRLFRDEVGQADKSVLDAVREDAHGFRGKVSRSDQQRLDEYLSSVREVEQRIEQAGKAAAAAGMAADAAQARHAAPGGWHPAGHRSAHAADVRHPGAGLPHRYHARCTLKLNNDHSSLRFPNLEASDLHDPSPAVAQRRQRLAEGQSVLHRAGGVYRRKMNQVQEGDRTLLDNSMILFLSSMMTGNHNNDQLPVDHARQRRRADQDRPRARTTWASRTARCAAFIFR